MDSHEQHKQWRNKLGADFFSWYWREAQKREEERLKMPWFYFTSCLLSPAVTNSYGKIPWWWTSENEGAMAYEYSNLFPPKPNHHLKIFLN